MAPSFTNKLVDCEIEFDLSNLAGKTAIVTGGETASRAHYEVNILTVLRC